MQAGISFHIDYIHFQAKLFDERQTSWQIFYKQAGEEVYVDMMFEYTILENAI